MSEVGSPAAPSEPNRFPQGGSVGRVASDSVANVVRVAVTALSVIAVTPIISRALTPSEFSLWVLAVSVSAYVMLAEAGVASAVTRFVSVDLTSGGAETPSIIATSIWTVALLSFLAAGFVATIALRSNWLFQDVPPDLITPAHWTVVILATSVGISMIGFAAQSYFFAVHRAAVPAVTTVVVRIGVAVGLIIAALQTRSVLWLALVTLVGSVVLTGSMIGLVRYSVGKPVAGPRLVRRKWSVALARHSSTLVWWSVAMLAITGLDVVIVGAFDFEKVGSYGVAAQGITFMLALFGAAIAPLSALVARTHAAGRSSDVSAMLVDGSRMSVTTLVVISSVLFVAAPWVLRLYVGAELVDTTTVILRILIVGNVIRNTCAPLGLTLIATGDHRRVLAPPFVEGAVNLLLSLWWVRLIGANGVAWATCLAAVVGVGLHLALTLPRTTAFSVPVGTFAVQAIARPAVAAVPVLIAFAVETTVGVNAFAATITVLIASSACAWFVSFTAGDRGRLRAMLEPRLRRLSR